MKVPGMAMRMMHVEHGALSGWVELSTQGEDEGGQRAAGTG